MSRAARAAKRRKDWHEGRINDARTPRLRLWAACGWLVAEAWRTGRLDDAIDAVVGKVHEIREEGTDASHDYAR